MTNRVLDPKLRQSITFRQAEGLEAIPAPLRFLEMDQTIRLEIWDTIFLFLELYKKSGASKYLLHNEGRLYARRMYRQLRKMPIDEAHAFSIDFDEAKKYFKDLILNKEATLVLELVQMTLRCVEVPLEVRDRLSSSLVSERTSYKIMGYPAAIISAGSPEERDRVSSDISAASAHDSAAYIHLKEAGSALSSGHYRNAIRESIRRERGEAYHRKTNCYVGRCPQILTKDIPASYCVHAGIRKALRIYK